MNACPVHPDHELPCRECEIDVAVEDPKRARRIPLRELVDHFNPGALPPTTDTTEETEA